MKCILLHTGRDNVPVAEPRPNHDEILVIDNQPAEQQENEEPHNEVVHPEIGENTLPTTYHSGVVAPLACEVDVWRFCS